MDGRAILAEPTKEFRLRPKILMHISGSKRNPILKRLAKRARASIVQRHRRQIAKSADLVRRCLKTFVIRKVSARRRRGPKKIGRAHVELQSLMRISYAVFCLTKKKITLNHVKYS